MNSTIETPDSISQPEGRERVLKLSRRNNRLTRSPKRPAQSSRTVAAEVIGRNKFQISRTPTETQSPIQKASAIKHSLLRSPRKIEPIPSRAIAITTHVEKIANVETINIYLRPFRNVADFVRTMLYLA